MSPPMPYIALHRLPIINTSLKDYDRCIAEHCPVSVESEGHREVNGRQQTLADHREVNGGQQTLAGHRSMFDQTFAHNFGLSITEET
jgi:hypothetical protein